MQIQVRVPATTSNLGAGFDCLGLALDLGLQVEIDSTSSGLQIELQGSETEGIALDAGNLIYASLCRVLRRAGLPDRALRIRIRNDIPLGRGLGSSAAAIVAGTVAGHLLAHDTAPERGAILRLATEIEGHPDNAAPALYGGLVASAVEGPRVLATRLPFPEALAIVLVIPEVEVSTHAARALLPQQVPLADAVHNSSRVALLLGGFVSGDDVLIGAGMRDRLHEMHRLPLVPGLEDALTALRQEEGCIGAALSGSGPTLLAFHRRPGPESGARAVEVLARHGIAARSRVQRPDLQGARWHRLSRGSH